MIILGIDPGSRKTGFGIIKVVGRKIEYIDSGVLRYDNVSDFLQRLGIIYDSILKLILKYEPSQVAFESLIYVKSVTSLAKLAQARGAMIAACQSRGDLGVFEYSPNLIKSSVAGFGHADKASIAKALSYVFGKRDYKTSDESDALAVALCHFMNFKSLKNNKLGARL